MSTFRTILAGLTGFPPPQPMSRRQRRNLPREVEDLNAGRRVYRDPSRKEKCYSCNLPDSAVIFVYAPATSQLPARDCGYCETCWRSNTANKPFETIK